MVTLTEVERATIGGAADFVELILRERVVTETERCTNEIEKWARRMWRPDDKEYDDALTLAAELDSTCPAKEEGDE